MIMKRMKRMFSVVYFFMYCKDLKMKKRLYVVQMCIEMERCVVKKKRYGKKVGEVWYVGYYLV